MNPEEERNPQGFAPDNPIDPTGEQGGLFPFGAEEQVGGAKPNPFNEAQQERPTFRERIERLRNRQGQQDGQKGSRGRGNLRDPQKDAERAKKVASEIGQLAKDKKYAQALRLLADPENRRVLKGETDRLKKQLAAELAKDRAMTALKRYVYEALLATIEIWGPIVLVILVILLIIVVVVAIVIGLSYQKQGDTSAQVAVTRAGFQTVGGDGNPLGIYCQEMQQTISVDGSELKLDSVQGEFWTEIAGQAPQYDLNGGTLTLAAQKGGLTQAELDWYVNMRFPYVGSYFSGKTASLTGVKTGALKSKYAGRKLMIYNLKTKKAVVGITADFGPAPWTGTGYRKDGSAGGNADQPNQFQLWGAQPRAHPPTGYNGRVVGGAPKIGQAIGSTGKLGDASGANGAYVVVGFVNDGTPLGPTPCTEITTQNAPVSTIGHTEDWSFTGVEAGRIDTSGRVPFIHQGSFANVAYPAKEGDNRTVSSSGSAVASLTMALKFNLGASAGGTSIADVADFAIKNGHRVSEGTKHDLHSALAKHLGLKPTYYGPGNAAVKSNWPSIVNALKRGEVVVIGGKGNEAPYTPAGHILLLTGLNDKGEVLVHDPARAASVVYAQTVFSEKAYFATVITK